jgi:hypothetical protein
MATRVGQGLTPPCQGAAFGLISSTQASSVIKSIFTACLGGALYCLYKSFKATYVSLHDLGQQLKFIKCQALLAEVEAPNQTEERRTTLLADCHTLYTSLSGQNKDKIGLRLVKNYLTIDPDACYAIAKGLSSHKLLFEAVDILHKKSDVPETIIPSLLEKAYDIYRQEPITENTAFSHVKTSMDYAKGCLNFHANTAKGNALERALICLPFLTHSVLQVRALCHFVRYYFHEATIHNASSPSQMEEYLSKTESTCASLFSPDDQLCARIYHVDVLLHIGQFETAKTEMGKLEKLIEAQKDNSVPSAYLLPFAKLLKAIRVAKHPLQGTLSPQAFETFVKKVRLSNAPFCRPQDHLNIAKACLELDDKAGANKALEAALYTDIMALPQENSDQLREKCFLGIAACELLQKNQSSLDTALEWLEKLYEKISSESQPRVQNVVGTRILTFYNQGSKTTQSTQFFEKHLKNIQNIADPSVKMKILASILAEEESPNCLLLPEQQRALLGTAIELDAAGDLRAIPVIAAGYLKTDLEGCLISIEEGAISLNRYWCMKILKISIIALVAFSLYCYGVKRFT